MRQIFVEKNMYDMKNLYYCIVTVFFITIVIWASNNTNSKNAKYRKKRVKYTINLFALHILLLRCIFGIARVLRDGVYGGKWQNFQAIEPRISVCSVKTKLLSTTSRDLRTQPYILMEDYLANMHVKSFLSNEFFLPFLLL